MTHDQEGRYLLTGQPQSDTLGTVWLGPPGILLVAIGGIPEVTIHDTKNSWLYAE
jgi:hypothetical protein